VKLRDGSALDVKSFLRSPGVLDLPGRCRGRLESWRKWSFPYDPPGQRAAAPAGWVTVLKRRQSTWFPLSAGQDPLGAGQDPPRAARPAGQTGCSAELTEAQLHGESSSPSRCRPGSSSAWITPGPTRSG
jgi:hypothetical protein